MKTLLRFDPAIPGITNREETGSLDLLVTRNKDGRITEIDIFHPFHSEPIYRWTSFYEDNETTFVMPGYSHLRHIDFRKMVESNNK
jgi:hypothetical protein